MINSTKSNEKKPVIIGISGASGSIIAYVTIEKLLKLGAITLWRTASAIKSVAYPVKELES